MSIKLQQIMEFDLGNNSEKKSEFHEECQKVLSDLAQNLALKNYSIISLPYGKYESGEVILHADSFYLSIGERPVSIPPVLIRSCKGQDDHVGGINNYLSLPALLNGNAEAAIRNICGL